MTHQLLKPVISMVDEHRALIIAKYPVRLFHYAELGVVMGCLFVMGAHSFMKKSPRWDRIALHEKQDIEKSPITPANSDLENHTDRDGDGIPNEWETANSHNPDFRNDGASDFDHDGLTALQEYQLWLRSNGQAGNPLGKWENHEIPIAHPYFDSSDYEYFHQYSYVSAANDRGDVIVQFSSCGQTRNGKWNQFEQPAFLKEDGTIQVINIPGKTSGYTQASDVNEQGEVLLQWYSEDWSVCESYIYKSEEDISQITINGNPCFAYRMNNFGDWIGYEITENQGWLPVQVVDGMSILPHDGFNSWWISDINDYGQVIGSYYDVLENQYLTFTQLGSMFFSTGREGDFPLFDKFTYRWQWPAAMNQWGEFTGGASGYNAQGEWRDSTFFYDGTYHDIKGREDQYYTHPADLSDAGMVLFGSYSPDYVYNKPYLWREAVSVSVDSLLASKHIPESASQLLPTKLSANGKIFLTRYDMNWQAQSIVILTQEHDSDRDGMPDDWEEFYGFNLHLNDANTDSDGDGTNNLGEFLLRSDPHAAPVYNQDEELVDTRPGVDTDGDGVPNNWELANGMNYQDQADAAMDFDRDGYDNLREFRLNTDPRGAPSYRISKIGPFTGVSGVDISNATLGESFISGFSDNFGAVENAEKVFFTASKTPALSGPVMWSQPRTADHGVLTFYPSSSEGFHNLVAQSRSGAVLTSDNSYPKVFTYWSSPDANPLTLTAHGEGDSILYLYNVTFSPSGKYLFAIRQNRLGIFEPVAWKMPGANNISYQPVIIRAPDGASIETWLTANINDYGILTANGMVNGQKRGLVWTMNEYGTTLEGSILPNLSGDNYTNVIGLSNHGEPIIAGTSLNSEYQERSTVWKYTSPTLVVLTDLGVLPHGNASQIVKISANGTLAGMANTLHENELKQHIICAVPVIPSGSDSIDPELYRLTPQGQPITHMASITHVTNAGEIIATIDNAAHDSEFFLLSKGRSHSLKSSIPSASGYLLQEIIDFNAQGTLLVTALKDNSLVRILLTPDRDTDGDGLPDAWENTHQFNPFSKNSANADSDNDGLTDLLEFANGTFPRISDSDGDGMKDGWEVEWGFLPMDPTDALLDPDQDRVTNLRESQIGSIPTGVYLAAARHVDTEWQYPQIIAVGEDGNFIRTGSNTNHYFNDGDESSYEYQQELLAIDPSARKETWQPPNQQGYLRYKADWTKFSYANTWGNYFFDTASGKIHGDRYCHHYQWDMSINENIYDEAFFLTPDITNFPDETNWISLDSVESNLRNPSFHNGSPPLSDSESLDRNAACVSPSGIRRLYATDSGQQILLNERGEFVEHLPNEIDWHRINDQGLASAIVIHERPETSDSICSYIPWLFVSDGLSFLLPHDPISSNYPDWALLFYSNDGKILLRNGYQNEQFTWTYRFFLFDSTTGRLSRIRMPALDQYSVSSMSNQNGRMLIQGCKPCQITPDGTCIQLDSLRVIDESHRIPVPLREMYSNFISPSHISSDGRITLTAINSTGNQEIIQISIHNDTDNDGLSDDWSLAHNVINAYADDDGDGLTNIQEYELHTDPKKADTDNDGIADALDVDSKVPATPTTDSDGDGVFDLEDSVPNDPEINWRKTPESQYVWIEQVTHDDHVGEPIAINKLGQILFGKSVSSVERQNRILWSSKSQQWIDLPQVGNIPITSPQKFISEMEIENIDFDLKSRYFFAINDEGKVLGASNGDALVAGMTWERSRENPEIYEKPRYFFPNFPLRKIGSQNEDEIYRYGIQVMGGRIAHDGAISAVTTEGYDEELRWSQKKSNSTPDEFSMIKEKTIESGYPGAILDKERALFIENPSSVDEYKLWLKEGESHTNVSFMRGEFAEMSELPQDIQGRNDRLWITTGTNCLIEKRIRGNGEDRWHKPASMKGEKIVRVSKHGVAIASGEVWRSNPPKLWRNGTYTNLNDPNLTTKPDGVKITNAIDIASNGMILVQATEGAIKKTGILVPVNVAVDANRDGEITFDGRDKTTSQKPFRFWINNDNDTKEDEEDPNSNGDTDNSDSVISTQRDLEDLTRIKISVGIPVNQIKNGSWKVGFILKNKFSSSIRIWANESCIGSNDYVKKEESSKRQMIQQCFGESEIGAIYIPQSYWQNRNESTAHLVFEGISKGDGEIVLILKNQSEELEIGSATVHLKLLDVRQMYQRAKITPCNPDEFTEPSQFIGNYFDPTIAPPRPQIGWSWDPNGNEFVEDRYEEKEYLIFVHGWNMSYDGSQKYAETMFKRLWQKGYKGRFAFVRWPTYQGLTTYNSSDYRAWQSGKGLADFVNSLQSCYVRNIVAHSMGNIVASSALMEGMKVDNYALLNAAVPAMCYDGDDKLYKFYMNTPDGDNDLITKNLGYKRKINGSGVARNAINFYLEKDSALTGLLDVPIVGKSLGWEQNNMFFKPESSNLGATGYKYDSARKSGSKLYITFTFDFGRHLRLFHESAAYATASRTKAVGAEGRTRGAITDKVDMDTKYGFGTAHSAQWKWRFQKTDRFYYDLMKNLDINANP